MFGFQLNIAWGFKISNQPSIFYVVQFWKQVRLPTPRILYTCMALKGKEKERKVKSPSCVRLFAAP